MLRKKYWYIIVTTLLHTPIFCDTDYDIIPLADVLEQRHDITYIKCGDALPFKYNKLPFTPYDPKKQPIEGLFAQTFVLKIPNGTVCSDFGWIKIGNCFIHEFITQLNPLHYQWQAFWTKNNNPTITKIQGSVAIITTPFHTVFGHWFNDIVGRLILLEQSGVHYDWLYAPKNAQYMKDTYELYGIPLDKIIDSSQQQLWIEADELMVPSLTMRRVPCPTDPVFDGYPVTYFWPRWIIDSVREKFLPTIERKAKDYKFGKKIFISRKDASVRRMINEDEIYELFKPYGFERYCMCEFTLLEQAIMFYGADYVIGAHGSALGNLLFSKPGTRVVEIFQNLFDTSLFNLAQDMHCTYHGIAAQQQMPNVTVMIDTVVPKEIIQEFIAQHHHELEQ